MKRACLYALCGILACVIASAADYATEMVDATCKFFHPAATATCFFVRREAPDQALYLVTAAHVLEHTTGDTAIVVLRDRHADGSYSRRDHTIAVRRDGKELWVRHATEDAAVLRLSDPTPVPVAALPMAALADEASVTAAGLHICSSVFVLTYPTRFEANDAGFAVARQGIIASHPFLPVLQSRTFLVNFTTFDGDSGGPVFLAGSDGHPLLIGIVLGQFRHDEQVTTQYEERTIHYPIGLGLVLHAQFIRHTLEQIGSQPVSK